MAALTSSNVRTIRAWTEGELTGKRRKVKRVEVHGAGLAFGGSSNTMPASAFGLSVIEEVSTPIYGTAGILAAAASDGAYVYTYSAVGGSPADTNVDATPNGMYFTVKGY